MEILRIGKQAVKVSLNQEEATKYNILNNEELNENEIKEAFSCLLKEIKSKTDFSYSNKKLFTEIFPSKNGGCEIYISCIGTEASKTVCKDKNPDIEAKKKITQAIYELDSLDKLLSVIYRLNEIKHREKASVYYDKDRKKYLLAMENINFKNLKYAFLLEYGKYIKCGMSSYLNEHYKCIVRNDAIKKLSFLA